MWWKSPMAGCSSDGCLPMVELDRKFGRYRLRREYGPLTDTGRRSLKWRRSLETNICLAKNEIPQNAACSTSPWARFDLFRACGGRPLGIQNLTSCSNSCLTTLNKLGGGLLHSRTRMPCLERGEMVRFIGMQIKFDLIFVHRAGRCVLPSGRKFEGRR